ncbi:MAG: ATP-binding protein [Ignavibacteriaceae bacterium]|nr:ATP-binding protein [Ignavibacteriaceae bacterium]
MNYQRPHLQALKTRINEPRKRIQVILGPRQVGKTTIINQLVTEINIPFHFVSADNQSGSNSLWIEQQWEVARIRLKTSGSAEFLLIFDEIQKIDDWSNAVKRNWDKDTNENVNIKVILLGSSTLLIQKGLSESLAGRFELLKMYHWSLTEMQSAFGISEEQYVWFGGYPGSVDLIRDERRWKDYIRHSLIETTISKDILLQTRIDKPSLLKNLFEVGCSYSGQILSYTKILGQLQDAGNTTTLSHYLNLLSNAGLLAGIEKYSPDIARQRASSPKFQVYNSALISSLSSLTFEEVILKPEKWGRVIESAVGAHLLNYSITEGYDIFYWRHNNHEIDFVLKYHEKVVGIEVKSTAAKKVKGAETFKDQFNPQKILLIGSSGLDWKEFLKINPIAVVD